MIKLSSFEPTADNVEKVVKIFKRKELPRLKKLYAYYKNDNKILNRRMESGKPNNKIVHEYCKYITNIGTGYFMGINVKYKSSKKRYLKLYNEIIKDNFEDDENFELAKQAAIHGYAAELLYQNEDGKTRFKRIDPKETIIIFSNKIDEFILGSVRYYTETDIDGNKAEYAEAYTDEEIIYFEKKKGSERFVETDREDHIFSEIPIILYKNNEEMESDFEGIITKNDAYDYAQSNSANDFDYFTDAYLVLSGGNGIETDGENSASDSEDVNKEDTDKTIRQKRVLFFPEKGDAKFLIKEINDTATENYKDRLNADIHKFSMTPDMSDEQFAGNMSGVAIKFKTIPLEDKTVIKVKKFRTGLRKRRELITNIINLKLGTNYDYREITEEFTRNLPQNDKEETERILSMAEYISRRTLLELLPQIEDVDQELKRLEAEEDDYSKKDYPIEEIDDTEDIEEPES